MSNRKDTAFCQITARRNGETVRLSIDSTVDSFILCSNLRREGFEIVDNSPCYTIHGSISSALETARIATRKI